MEALSARPAHAAGTPHAAQLARAGDIARPRPRRPRRRLGAGESRAFGASTSQAPSSTWLGHSGGGAPARARCMSSAKSCAAVATTSHYFSSCPCVVFFGSRHYSCFFFPVCTVCCLEFFNFLQLIVLPLLTKLGREKVYREGITNRLEICNFC